MEKDMGDYKAMLIVVTELPDQEHNKRRENSCELPVVEDSLGANYNAG